MTLFGAARLEAAGMTFMRDYRVVPADFDLPESDELSGTEGEHLAEMAQRELRRRLRDGEVPDVVLASPARASRAEIEHGGVIPHEVYAWMRYEESSFHASACAARLEADTYAPDWQPDWAGAGAVILQYARVVEIYVSLWLGPVADQLEALTGVPVHVQPVPEVAEPIVRPGPPSIAKALFTPDQCAELRDFLDARSDGGAGREVQDAPQWAWRIAHDAIVRYGTRLGLPVTTSYSQINAYRPGEKFPAHADAATGLAKALDRTASIHVLLGQPGDDWQGGQFRAWKSDDLSAVSVPVDAGIGDGILYTARTFHEITEVTHGERYALVVKGEVDR